MTDLTKACIPERRLVSTEPFKTGYLGKARIDFRSWIQPAEETGTVLEDWKRKEEDWKKTCSR